jgi:WhiB family redox-sensing transcriptional regulator
VDFGWQWSVRVKGDSVMETNSPTWPGLDRLVQLPGGGLARADAVREVWASALCAQVDPELFFPEKGQPSGAAKAVCAACPVTELCLATFGPLVGDGVVGGLTAGERRELRRAERRASERPAAA